VDRELRAFLDAVKERLEVIGGERAGPMQRAITVADLKATGLVKVAVRNNYAELTGAGSAATGGASSGTSTEAQSISNALSLFAVGADAVGTNHVVILWDRETGSYRRIDWADFATLFAEPDDAYPMQLRHAGIA
jgi:hypothetical protein